VFSWRVGGWSTLSDSEGGWPPLNSENPFGWPILAALFHARVGSFYCPFSNFYFPFSGKAGRSLPVARSFSVQFYGEHYKGVAVDSPIGFRSFMRGFIQGIIDPY
jgi:hypothetical protein